MIKIFLFLLIFIFTSQFTKGQVNSQSKSVKSYSKKDGTYVQTYKRTSSNKTNKDNYSTKPNTNFYTGSKGYKAKDYSPAAYNYGKGKTISSGPKGGQYYNNQKGSKTYVPKR